MRALAPATPLARVQQHWRATAGERIASETDPVSERDGVVTIACRSAVWAGELELLSGELVERLNRVARATDGPPLVRRLRFVTRSRAGDS